MVTAQATQPKTIDKPAQRERKAPPSLHDLMKNQLTNAALRGKIEEKDLDQLESHIHKLKNLLVV